MLFRKSTADIAKFATDLAARLARRYPPELDAQPGRRPSVNRLTRIVEEACAQVVAFQAEHKLSWLGKARLGNSFCWELTELGYTKEFVDFATEAVIVHLSQKGEKKTV